MAAFVLWSEDVFGNWNVDTIEQYLRENDVDHIERWQIEDLIATVASPPVGFVCFSEDDEDLEPYWDEKDLKEDCESHRESGLEPIVTLALSQEAMCEFLCCLLDSAF